jgi:hypothetical protein
LQSITRKLDLDDLVVVAINGRRPTQAFTSSRARGFLCIPINLETRRIKALLLFGLPLVISSGRCDQIDPVLLTTLHTLLGFGIISVSQMLFRQQILFLEALDGSPASHPHPRCPLGSSPHG